MAAAGVGLAVLRAADDLDEHGANVLPAFDAYVYAAMAEEPRVFTLAPWGYRLLPAVVARAVPLPPATAYAILTPLLLALASVLVFLWLRRLGFRPVVGLLGTAAFAFSPPVAHAVRYSVLAEPAAVALQCAFLLALATAAPAGVLAVLLLLGVAAKELLLVLLLPVVVTADVARIGLRRALLRAAAVAAPAAAWLLLVRRRWPAPADPGSTPPLADAWALLAQDVGAWAWPLLLGGVLPLALAGALRPGGPAFLRRWGVLLLPALVLPFAAALYVPGSGGAPAFFPADVERLLVYALPVLIALAAHVGGEPSAPAAPERPGSRVAWAAAGLLALTPLLLDGYRRLDLTGPRDGPRLLALCRGTLATARRLEAGRPVIWRFPDHGYQPVRMAPEYLDRTRWFLLEGWGARAYFGLQPVVLQQERGTLLLPVLDATRDVEVALAVRAPAPGVIAVEVNGHAVHQQALPAGESRAAWRVPAATLVRGDNVMSIRAVAGLAVDRLGLHPAAR